MKARESEEVSSFHWKKVSDLEYLARLSPLMPVRRAVWGIVLFFLVAVLFLFVLGEDLFGGQEGSGSRALLFGLGVFGAGLVIFLAYWELYRRLERVEIDGYRLQVTKGVVWKTTGSVHLLPHTTFYVTQGSFWDVLFGLADLHVHPAVTPQPEIVSIHGLKLSRAHQLKSYLTQQIDRQLGTRSKAPVTRQPRSEVRSSRR